MRGPNVRNLPPSAIARIEDGGFLCVMATMAGFVFVCAWLGLTSKYSLGVNGCEKNQNLLLLSMWLAVVA
jgi:hypothetical protein